MQFLLRWDGVNDAAEVLLNLLDLIPRGVALSGIQFRGSGPCEPPLCAVHNGSNHLQVAQ
jgi:hypothetical protein